MMTDWLTYSTAYSTPCLVEGPWAGQVDWEGAPPGDDWFFLLGFGHCGSSVLAEMLNLHSDMYAANEDKTVLNLLGLVSTRTIIMPRLAVLHWQSGPWSGREKPFACETRVITAAFMRDLCEVWRAHYAGDRRFCGDKHQHYLTWRHRLRQVFPGCKFVYCTRHPLDQLSGLLHDDWLGNRALVEQPEAAWGQVLDYIRWRRTMSEEPDVLTVQYEDFATEEGIAAALSGCAAHLGAEAAGWQASDLRPFARTESVERWRHDDALALLLVIWEKDGLAADQQREALMLPAEEFAAAQSGVTW